MSVFPRDNRSTWLCSRSPWCILAILSSMLLEGCVLKGKGLMKLIIFIVYKGILNKSHLEKIASGCEKYSDSYCGFGAIVNIV